jgi:acetamidase/formamidase
MAGGLTPVGGFIKNNDSADDVRDIDLSIVHFLSGPIGVKGAEPGDLPVAPGDCPNAPIRRRGPF